MTVNRRRAGGVGAIFLALWLAGCQSAPGRWGPELDRRIDDTLQQARAAAAPRPAGPPPEVQEALLPPLEAALPGGRRAPVEERFDLVVSDAPVREVFVSLVEGTPYSLVIHPEVSGTVSLNLKGITLREALDTLRDVYGYEYRLEGSRILVLAPGLQTRVFRVNYLNLSRKGKSDTRVSSGELTRESPRRGAVATRSQGNRNIRPSTQVETESRADFWKELGQALVGLVGEEGGRKVVLNPQAGLVVVRALPRELRSVERFLGAAHERLGRQVLLEAKIVEVELKDGFQSGVNWSKIYEGKGGAGDQDITLGQIGGGSVFQGAGKSDIAGDTGDLNPNDPSLIQGTLTSAFGGVFTLALQSASFTGFLELLKTQGDVHVLSSPRVATVNNQKAVIKVGADQFFITGVTSATTTNLTSTAPTVELTPFFSGIALDVTPQIDGRRQLVLHVHPTVSEVTQRNQSFVVGSESFNLPLAVSSIQESDSIVRAHSGQIIVIGGLMKEAVTDDHASVPVLGEVPLLGNLFKHRRVSRIKKELVILLKPTVIETGDQWAAVLEASEGRLQDQRRGWLR